MDALSLATTTVGVIAPALPKGGVALSEIEENRRHWQALRATVERRLRALELKAAQTGADTDPSISIEIEDLRAEIQRLDGLIEHGDQSNDQAGIAAPLVNMVKNKLIGDPYAEQTFKRIEEDPISKSRQAALAGVLEEKISADPAFAKALQKLLDEAKAAGAESITQQVTVTGHARTGDVTQIGKIQGAVDLSKKH